MTEVPLCGQVAREVLHPQAVGFRHRASVTADRTALTFMSDIVTSIPLPVPRHRDLAVEAACVSPSKGGPISDFDHAGRFGGLKDGALHFQRCRWCRTPVFRRVFCPACASDDLDLERSGALASSAVPWSCAGTMCRTTSRWSSWPRGSCCGALSSGWRVMPCGPALGCAWTWMPPPNLRPGLSCSGLGAALTPFGSRTHWTK
ncbi:zinc ribbon domain-containing protein [Streptomyces akebiae]